MSRVGNKPIKIENGVDVNIEQGGRFNNLLVTVKGPKGELSESIRHGIEVKLDADNNEVVVSRKNNLKHIRSYHGLYRMLIDNMIVGVTQGYAKKLEIHGVGYRAKLVGKDLELSLGLNHPIKFEAPEGIVFEVEKEINITVTGINKAFVGNTAAKIRELKKPEPYKGKGIRYEGEYVRRKVGKAAAK